MLKQIQDLKLKSIILCIFNKTQYLCKFPKFYPSDSVFKIFCFIFYLICSTIFLIQLVSYIILYNKKFNQFKSLILSYLGFFTFIIILIFLIFIYC